jgi:hypothetical protein
MIRLIAVVAAIFVTSVAIGGCSGDDGGGDPLVIVVQPSVVPASADLVESETVIGTEAAGPGERRLSNFTCADGVVTVATTVETIYAELPCDRFVTPEQAAQVRDVAVLITIRPVPDGLSKLIIRSETRASIEFTIGHAWVVEP